MNFVGELTSSRRLGTAGQASSGTLWGLDRRPLLGCSAVSRGDNNSVSHRKAVKHYEATRAVHELTFSCYRRMPLLTNDVWRRMLSESITRATAKPHFDLLAFVFMPEHVHLLVLPRDGSSRISNLLKAIKRPYSYRIKRQLIDSESPLLQRLTIAQRPGVETFRYWQEGPGYDRNLETRAAIEAALRYIHLNPVHRKLCEVVTGWKWSSARYYHLDDYEADLDLPRIDGMDASLLE